MINSTECVVLYEYIRKYRPDLVKLAKAYDVEIAAALAHGMLISGFPVEDFDTCQINITKIIMNLVIVCHDGSIRKRESTQHLVRAESGQPIVEKHQEEAAKELDENIKKKKQNLKRTSKAEQGPRKRRRRKSSH